MTCGNTSHWFTLAPTDFRPLVSRSCHVALRPRPGDLCDITPPGSRAVARFGRLPSMSRLDRISSDPLICHGQPTVRGLRYPVETILELLASGMTIEDILDDHPDLEREDVLAALEFGALASGMRRVVPLGAA